MDLAAQPSGLFVSARSVNALLLTHCFVMLAEMQRQAGVMV